MGSLVPGWDSAMPGVPPPDYMNHDESSEGEEERPGYFAAYERYKKQRHAMEVPMATSMPDRTISGPLHWVSTSPGVSAGVLLRQSSLDEARNRRHEIAVSPTAPGSKSEAKAHGSLARRSLPMDSMMAANREGGHLSPGSTPTSRDQGSLSKTSLSHSWWRDFSSGRLNEIPDDMLVEERPAHRPSTYIPQYDVAGRKHLAGEVEEQQPGSDTKIA